MHITYSLHLQSELKLSENQIQDLMHLRQLYLIKRHLLALRRATITAQIQEHSANPLADVMRLSTFASQLQESNTVETVRLSLTVIPTLNSE